VASIQNINIGDSIVVNKKCAISSLSALRFLHSAHPNSSYGETTNPDILLAPNDKLIVIGKGKRQTKYAQSYITCKIITAATSTYQNEFDIFADDIKRFIK
jgi:hypothetical protein